MKVNVAVCGRFHYHKWVNYLAAFGLLEKFYYSYKWHSSFGLPKHVAKNKWLKEYLLALHGRVLGNRFLEPLLPIYHRVWESEVLKDWIRPDVAHVLLHGTALRLIDRCQVEGTCVVGEAVNAHPDAVNRILATEHERLGLRYQRFDSTWDRMKQEYDRCQCILVSSDWVARSFIEAGFLSYRICKLPYPSRAIGNKTGPQIRPGTGRKVRVLCVAGIHVRKGQHYLLEAVRRLNKRNGRIKFEATLVGAAANKDYFSILRKIGEPFDYIAHIPNQEMVHFISGFDVFVLPSLEDGFSVVVSEALQAGVPVVTTQNNGAADTIVDGKNGFVVPAQDNIALANAITDAVDLSVEHSFLAPGQLPDWRTYTEKLIKIYRRSLS